MSRSNFDQDFDDSSDDEEIQIKLRSTVRQEWQKFKTNSLNKLTDNGLTEEQARKSFFLHYEGIKAMYESGVANKYYQRKGEKLGKLDKEEQKEAIVEIIKKVAKKIVKDVCQSVFQEPISEKKIEESTQEILDKATSTIEDIANEIIENRIIGDRLSNWDSLKDCLGGYPEIIVEEVLKKFSDKELKRPQKIKASYDSPELNDEASEVAEEELHDMYTEIDGSDFYLLPEGKAPKINVRNQDVVFDDYQFKELLVVAWREIRNSNTNSIVTFHCQEITKAYLRDLIVMDGKDQNSVDSDVWKIALKYKDVRDLLELSYERVESIFVPQFDCDLKSNLEQYKIERLTLPESFEFVSEGAEDFLANLRLSNRSQTRTARNFKDFEEPSEMQGETFQRQWKFGENPKPALEEQEINKALSRVDMVNNLGNYKEVYEMINKFKDKHHIDDKCLADWIRKILSGNKIEDLKGDQGQNMKFNNQDKKFLINIVYLMFGVETARNPASFIANFMILDLIESDNKATRISWQDVFASDQYGQRYSGGVSPMSIGRMSEGKTSGEVVASARKLHSLYKDFMPHSYKYEGKEATNMPRVAELVKREAEIVEKWCDMIGEIDDLDLSEKINEAKKSWYEGLKYTNASPSPSPSISSNLRNVSSLQNSQSSSPRSQ